MNESGTEPEGINERTIEMIRLITEVKERMLRLEILVSLTMDQDVEVHPVGLKLKNGDMFHFTKAEVEWLQDHYPAVRVEHELKKMAEWCEHNQAKRKTSRGIKRFVTYWLKGAANKNSKHDALSFLNE